VEGGRGRPWELFYRLVGAGRGGDGSNGHQWPWRFQGIQEGGI
jgi:hypothetical protein